MKKIPMDAVYVRNGEGSIIAMQIELRDAAAVKKFQTLVRRGANTWDGADAETKTFIDWVTDSPTQDYHEIDGVPMRFVE